MKEAEYIKATNRVKISMALTILRNVLPGQGIEYGIDSNELTQIIQPLSKAEEKLFSLIEIEE
jgi:hypothetical protein